MIKAVKAVQRGYTPWSWVTSDCFKRVKYCWLDSQSPYLRRIAKRDRDKLQQELVTLHTEVSTLSLQLAYARDKQQERKREAESLKEELESTISAASKAQQDYVCRPLFPSPSSPFCLSEHAR